MSPDVATLREQMKVSTMIRPNKVSEIRSIGSNMRSKEGSETSDIESNAYLAQSRESDLPAIVSAEHAFLHGVGSERSLKCRSTKDAVQDAPLLTLHSTSSFSSYRTRFHQRASGTILRELRSGLLRATLRFGNLTSPRGTFL